MPNWRKLIVSGSDAALNSLNVTSALTASGLIYPTTDGDNGDFLLTDGAGNLSFSRSTVFANVKNVSGVELQKGTPVHATGTAGNASEVIAASASVASTMPATYILNETLADDAEGLAIITGYINGVNTSLFGEGDVVYVGENGGFTNVKPQGSGNLIQNLGVVSKVDAGNGSGYVYGSGRSNDVPNLPTNKIWVGSDTYSVTSSILTLDEGNSQAQITGSLTISSVANADTDTDKFLVLDSSNNVDFRTGTQVLSDIGGTSCVGTVTSVTAGAGMTQTGTSTINPTLNVIGGTAITVNADNIEVTSTCNTAWNAKTTCTGTVTSVGTSAPLTGGTITSTGTIGITQATTSTDGYLSSTDWNTFNNKTTCTGTVTSVGGTGTVSGLTLTGTVTTSGNLTLGGTFSTTTSSISNFNTGVGTIIDGCGFTTCTGTVTGTGTTNYVSKWTGTSSQGNSLIFDNGTNVGIGTTSPAAKLDVNQDATAVALNVTGGGGGTSLATFTRDVGAAGSSISINAQNNFPQIQFTNTGNTFSIGGDTSGNFKISDANAIGTNDRITIDNTGNVGIGTTSPGAKLDVIGDISGSTTLTIGSSHSNTGTLSTIAGGTLNTGSAACSFIGGGSSNINNGLCYTFIGGGNQNCLSGNLVNVTIGGGYQNKICRTSGTDYGSTLGGGYQNLIQDTSGATISGGYLNCISGGEDGVIVGGSINTLTSIDGFIGGGCRNYVNSNHTSIVGGYLNSGSSACSFIGGGISNSVSGVYGKHTIVGGDSNCINSFGGFGFIGGGKNNCVGSGTGYSVIGGGQNNTVSSYYYNAILGGIGNTVCDNYSVVVGGNNNCIPYSFGGYKSIVGGRCNTISTYYGAYNFMGGGFNNCLDNSVNNSSVIVGGTLNTGSGACGFIGGGCLNNICSGEIFAVIGGGRQNIVDGDYSSIAGGYLNCVIGIYSFIGGGNINKVNNNNATIAGGNTNCACGYGSFIGGGRGNTLSTTYSSIVGGYTNTISGYYGFIGGGRTNSVSGYYSSVVNGYSNTVSGWYGFIGGGTNNTVSGYYSSILGGTNNTVSHTKSFIVGSDLTSTATCYTFMNNACVAGTTRTTTLVETSARRYKECILPLQDQIENIKKLEPVEFQWKKDKTKDIGFIAEEVKEIFPNLVSYEENGEINGIQYSKLTTVLVKALQQQQQQIDELKKEIENLKQK